MDHFNNDNLVAELNALGVHFLWGGHGNALSAEPDPSLLLSSLALSNEARLRLALIPLFLQRPDFALVTKMTVQALPPSAQITLKCYYTAAMLIQQKYSFILDDLLGKRVPLPDLFSTELGIQALSTPDTALHCLADRQTVLSGQSINWYGTYEHAARRFLAYLARERE